MTDPDGNTTSWTYDAAGREKSSSYNGKLLAAVDRDAMSRRVVIADHTGADGLTVEHELGFNRRGQLTSRTRGGQGLSWEYDADGHRTGLTDANGTTTTYRRDAAGRVKAVHNPLLGEAVLTHDAAGRLTAVTAGDLVQEWAYRNGFLAEHTRTNVSDPDASADITLIGRDADGRITGLTRAGAVTRYGYDGAGQLIAAATTATGGPDASATVRAQVSEWEYDDGGRLVREVTPAGTRTFAYDAAGQLASVTEPDGSRTEYVFDGLGRRSRLIGPDGSWTEYAWGDTGYLHETVDRTPDGEETAGHELWVDALGELASVDGCPVWWDTASPVPALAGISGQQVLNLPGGVTGIGAVWVAPGWRAARPTDREDPWAVLGVSVVPVPGAVPGMGAVAGSGPGALFGLSGLDGVLPSGVGLTGGGGLEVAGLEWLGARAYDPLTRGFLSTDPLAPVLGAGWDGNPYAYAGNNPLNATDPTGLQPLTDEELKAYDGSSRGFLAAAGAAVGEWWKDNWEYVVAGAAIVAGVALMFTGVGGPVGVALIGAASGALISGGASIAKEKMGNGQVDWGKVGKDLIGGASGLVGGGAAGVMSKFAPSVATAGTGAGQSVLRLAFSSTGRAATSAGASGATSNVADYHYNSTGKRTAMGYVGNAVTGFGTSAGFGILGSKVTAAATSRLPITPVYPEGLNSHVMAPNVARWTTGVNEGLDRITGGVSGVSNEIIRTGGQVSREELIAAGTLGVINGADGPTVGVHRAP